MPAVVVSLKEEILPSSEEESSSSRPSSPLSAEEEALNMSVSDILSEFWAGYSEPEEQPAHQGKLLPVPAVRRAGSALSAVLKSGPNPKGKKTLPLTERPEKPAAGSSLFPRS